MVEKYAINKNIDLILDSTSYIIASNAIDITEEIENELKEKKLKLEFKDFEKIKFNKIISLFRDKSISFKSDIDSSDTFSKLTTVKKHQ